MSLILDALRRAESQRERDLGRRVSHGLPPLSRRQATPWIAGMAVLAALAVAATVWWVSKNRETVLSSASAPVEISAPAPVLASRDSSLADIAVPLPAPMPVESVAPLPARSMAPLLHELSESVRATVPALSLNAHVWSEDPARRFVMVDMRRLRDGEMVREGLRVVAILPEGVEFDWRGTRFRVLSQ